MKLSLKIINGWIAALLVVVLVSGCGAQNTTLQGQVGNISDERLFKSDSGEDLYFTIPISDLTVKSNLPISIVMAGKIDKGKIRFVLRDPNGQEVWYQGTFNGEFTANSFFNPKTAGDYHLGVAWEAATSGIYNLQYTVLGATALALLPGIGMILVALAFVVYALRQSRRLGRSGWGYLGLGALSWVVTVAVKFAIALVLNPTISKALWHNQLFAPSSLVLYLYIGLLTGITEVWLTWLLLRYTRLGKVDWGRALAFGAGFGAFEALLLGVSNFASAAIFLTMPQTLPANAVMSLANLANPLYGAAPIVERIATIFVHVLCSVLLFYGVLTHRSRWMWMAFLFKSLLDSVAAFAQFWGVGSLEHLWVIEGVIVLFGIIGWWGIGRVAERYRAYETAQRVEAILEEPNIV